MEHTVGLCHFCLRSNVRLTVSRGRILCADCLAKADAKN